MGRIKSLAIKRTTKKLIEEFPNLFTTDFEENKKILNEILKTDKKTRNAIAGYLVRLLKQQHAKT